MKHTFFLCFILFTAQHSSAALVLPFDSLTGWSGDTASQGADLSIGDLSGESVASITVESETFDAIHYDLGSEEISDGVTATLEIEMYIPDNPSNQWAFHFFGITDTDAPASFGDMEAYLGVQSFTTGGNLQLVARDGGTTQQLGLLSVDTWYDLEMTINADDTYDVRLDGALLADDIGFRNGATPNALDTLTFFGNTNRGNAETGREVLFDNVTLTVIPEPGTATLVILSVAALTLVRHRR